MRKDTVIKRGLKAKSMGVCNVRPIVLNWRDSISFYIIYVNALHYAVNCTPRLYADDTCLLVEGKTEGKLHNLLNTELYKLSNWMIVNQLTVNPKNPRS